MHEAVTRVMWALAIVMGTLAVGVGLAAASARVRRAHRIYYRTASFSAGRLDGWGDWFLGGFSGVTVGLRWLYAVGSWLAWTLVGVCFIGMGLRVFEHR